METTTVSEIRIDPSDWGDHVATPGHPQIVVGGPGTGKTEFLCRRIASAISAGTDPHAIVILTFSRLSVNDIRTRLFDAIGSPSYQVQVATYHSLANRLVEANYSSLGWQQAPAVLAGPEHEDFVLSVLKKEDPSRWADRYRSILGTNAMASELTDFILRFHEQNNTVADLARTEIPEWEGISGFLTRYNNELTASHRIDYGRLLNEAVAVVESDSNISDSYHHVFADEYQDTSPVQARILFGLSRTSRSLTVAADPYQSIYSFRGTDMGNVLGFPAKAFEALGGVADRLVLTTSFRVPQEILAAAVNVTGRELPGAAGKVASVRTKGSVESHIFGSPDSESEWIASDIERLHLVDGVDLNRIAIFTRSGGPFQQRVAASLERRRIPHGLTLEQLEDQPVVRFVYDLVASASGAQAETDVADTMRSLLLGPFVAAPHGAVNEVVADVEGGTSWPDAIATRIAHAGPLADLLRDPSWADSVPARTGLWQLWNALPQLHSIANDDDRISDRMAWSAFSQAVTRMGERAPKATLRDQQMLASSSDIEADALFSFRSGAASGVTIATMHRAKGTEYDAVYVAHAVEGLLPDLREKDSLLRTRLLNPHLPEERVEYMHFRLNEERRLAYTAMTRATDRVVWTATELDSKSEQIRPSQFLAQVASPTVPTSDATPLTHRGYEAMLRRTLRDPLADDVERLASLTVLADAVAHGFVDQAQRYGTAERGGDTGFIAPDHRSSPSQANTYSQCPRRYALERFATKKDSSSPHMTFGTLIHKVLEIAEAEVLESDAPRSTFERAIEILDEVWDELGFGDDSIGRAWYRRAEVVLTNLYEKWPNSADVVAVETDVRIDLADTSWAGKIDRVEVAAGKLTVVDYKTSRKSATVPEAKESLQLGFYLLAAQANDDLSGLGEVAAAEFWFPFSPPKVKSIVTREFDIEKLTNVREQLIDVAHGIRAEEFPAILGDGCDQCDFAHVCPARSEGREAFVS